MSSRGGTFLGGPGFTDTVTPTLWDQTVKLVFPKPDFYSRGVTPAQDISILVDPGEGLRHESVIRTREDLGNE